MSKRKPKQIVRIRERELVEGNISLYFIINYQGRRWTHTPGIYLSPATTPENRKANNQYRELAENLRSKMQLDIVHGRYGFISEHNKKMNAVTYFDELYNIKKEDFKPSNQRLWKNALKHFNDFVSGNILFSDIDEKLLERYKSYLLKRIGARTAHYYFMVLKQVLTFAFNDKIILSNPCSNVKGIPFEEGEIVHLTWEEVQRLKETECKVEIVKKAFIFSVLTGIRHVDLKQIKWYMLTSDVKERTTTLTYTQQKTGKIEYAPITQQALEQLGVRGNPDELIFEGLYKCTKQNQAFKNWIQSAKVNKPISFHKARVTFGTLALTYDTDIYTVKDLLGHKSLRSTERYVQVVDDRKRKAVERFPIL